MDQDGLERRVSIPTYKTDISYCRSHVMNMFPVFKINIYCVAFFCGGGGGCWCWYVTLFFKGQVIIHIH